MRYKHYQTVDHAKISIFQIHQIFNISYFPQFNLSFEKKYVFLKMPKNHPKSGAAKQ